EILEGGAEKVIEAKAVLAGGHSVQDEEPKYGLAVFGEVLQDEMWTVAGARIGDALILTKPAGTGIAVTAIKAGLFEQKNIDAAVKSMTALNSLPEVLPQNLRRKVHACTDLTGFGLASHALDLAGTGVSVELDCRSVPLLPGIAEMADMGLVPAGSYENKKFVGSKVRNESELGRLAEDIVFDPQTSGGLLIALPQEYAEEVCAIARRNGFPDTAVVGRFIEGDGEMVLR
ncbi:MAG: selenide, water dikinase SelD, partial [Synergistes sp.]|nr:selenide, water dikinase SelD [Synergistes sp.]